MEFAKNEEATKNTLRLDWFDVSLSQDSDKFRASTNTHTLEIWIDESVWYLSIAHKTCVGSFSVTVSADYYSKEDAMHRIEKYYFDNLHEESAVEEKKMLTLKKAFVVDENTVKVLYLHNERLQEFVVEWSNIHSSTSEVTEYNLELDCLSSSLELNEIVMQAIRDGEDCDTNLYLELRDTFSHDDARELATE